jgi:hypothetical protein
VHEPDQPLVTNDVTINFISDLSAATLKFFDSVKDNKDASNQ